MEKETYLKKAFTRLDQKVDDLYEMLDEKKKVLFVEWHKYSAEDLYNSHTYQSIQSAIEKIGDDINNWEQNKELNFSIRNTYNANRDLLEDRVEDLNRAIMQREPTIWEKIGNFFKSFVKFIIEHLPKLWNGLMLAADRFQNTKVVGVVCKVLLKADKFVRKLLLPHEKQYITEIAKE
ncbi:MAG: hypothetical protein P1P64_04775 [Treponemataceae bacterium]